MKWLLDILRKFYMKQSSLERISPNDWIKDEDITYLEIEGLLTIKLKPKVWVTGVTDTNSMDGLVDYGHHAILTTAFDKGKLAVGDIVCYNYYGKLILHRIVQIKEGANRLYKCRGDNCITDDPYWLGDNNIKYLCVGFLY